MAHEHETSSSGGSEDMVNADLLVFLRQRLVDAKKKRDTRRLQDLRITLDLLLEYTHERRSQNVGRILEALEAATRDAITDVSWKSELPTDEEIQSATS